MQLLTRARSSRGDEAFEVLDVEHADSRPVDLFIIKTVGNIMSSILKLVSGDWDDVGGSAATALKSSTTIDIGKPGDEII